MSPLLVDKLWENVIIEGNSEKLACVHSLFWPIMRVVHTDRPKIYDTTNFKNLYFE